MVTVCHIRGLLKSIVLSFLVSRGAAFLLILVFAGYIFLLYKMVKSCSFHFFLKRILGICFYLFNVCKSVSFLLSFIVDLWIVLFPAQVWHDV